jgi:hypothetical protein
MAESYITRKGGGGGAAINGLIESYKVKAGETVSAGDFVDFVNQEVGTTVGSSHVFQSNAIQTISGLMSGTLVEEDKVLITYYDESASDRGVAVVIKITGSTISSGTPFNFNENATTYFSQVTLIDTNKVLIVYRNAANSNYGTAKILTINDTTITGSSAVVFESSTLGSTSLLFLETNKALVAYNANSTGIVKVLTISGDNISVGNATQFNSSQSGNVSLSYIRTNKALVAYTDNGNSSFGTVKIITINNTATSVGSSFVFHSASTTYINNVLVETGKVALVFRNEVTNEQKNISLILNISTSDVITAGTPLVLGGIQYIYATLGETNQILIIYQDTDNGYFGSYRILTVNGDTLTATNSAFFNNGIVGGLGAIKTSNNKAIIYYRNHANSFYGTATLLNLPYTEELVFPATDQIFGVAKTAGTGGQTIDVYVDETAGPFNIEGAVQNFTVATGETITAGTFVNTVKKVNNYTLTHPIARNSHIYRTPTVIKLSNNRVIHFITGTHTTQHLVGNIYEVDGANLILLNSTFNIFSVGVQYKAALLEQDKIILSNTDGSGNFNFRIITINADNSYTLGSIFTFNMSTGQYLIDIDTLTSTTAICIFAGTSNYPYARVLQISGTTITAGGSNFTLNTSGGTEGRLQIVRIDNTRAVAIYSRENSSSRASIRILSVSGTTITAGTALEITTSSGNFHSKAIVLDSSRIAVLDFNYRRCFMFSYSGTSLTLQTTTSLSLTHFPSQSYANAALIDTDKIMIIGRTGTGTNSEDLAVSTMTFSNFTPSTIPYWKIFTNNTFKVESVNQPVVLDKHRIVSSFTINQSDHAPGPTYIKVFSDGDFVYNSNKRYGDGLAKTAGTGGQTIEVFVNE